MKQTEVENQIDAIMCSTKVGDLSAFAAFHCQMCDSELLPEDFTPTYKELEKLNSWTMAQLIAFRTVQRRSGIGYRDLLERTSGGVMPGIGGALAGDVGTIGVNDLNGIFVGIEPDGYTHS